MERGHEHRVAERIERGQRLAVLDDDLADGRQPIRLEHGFEQVERLASDLVRLEVVGGLHEADRRVIPFGLGELLDLDRSDGLERHALQVFVRDDDVLTGRIFVTLDRVATRDRLVLHRAPDLHLDPGQIVLVEHVETDALGFGREIELDRDGNQAELDGSLPHRSRHGSTSPACRSSGSAGPGRRDGHDSAPRQDRP